MNAVNIDKYTYVNLSANINFICFNDWTIVCIRHFLFQLNNSKGAWLSLL